jgi:predicted dehydrogenase
MGGYLFPSGLPRPTDTPPVPETLDWDLWLGPAPHRPYHPVYAPIYWRGWLDFGTGSLGDMGCHILDPAFWALNLAAPESVEANVTYNPDNEFWMNCLANEGNPKADVEACLDALRKETYPVAAVIRYEFPARGEMAPMTLTWYDGGMFPPRIKDEDKGFGGNGAYIVGDKGVIKYGGKGAGGCRMVPEEKMQEYAANLPPKTIKRVGDHHQDWIEACKGGDPASSNFAYGGALTEMVLLGVIATRIRDTKLKWDSGKMEFTNSDEANAFVSPAFREGWTL